MKKILFAMCVLSATAAFAQYGQYATVTPQIQEGYQFPSHEQHASYTPMAQGQSLFAPSSSASAQGERPLTDFPMAEPVPLGTAAREIRKQNAAVKKTSVVWVN
jgi:hypothetical protein